MAVRLDFNVQRIRVDGDGEDSVNGLWGNECGGGHAVFSKLSARNECWGV